MTKYQDTQRTFAPKKHRVHLSLDKAQFVALQALRKDTGAPVAELLRRAIAAYLVEAK